jgi:hypothetical protein
MEYTHVKKYFKRIGNEFAGATAELQKEVMELKDKIRTLEMTHKNELLEIGKIILDNDVLVRRLVSNGWDTLEIHDTHGTIGLKWQLKKHTRSIN